MSAVSLKEILAGQHPVQSGAVEEKNNSHKRNVPTKSVRPVERMEVEHLQQNIPITDAETADESDVPTKVHPKLASRSKKIQKFKRCDFKNAKLKSIGLPRRIASTKNCKRRWAIDVVFDADGKERKRLVRFGKEGKDDYIDHKDELKRLKTVNRLSNDENFLHPNFYKLYLLNSKQDNIYDAHRDLIQQLSLI